MKKLIIPLILLNLLFFACEKQDNTNQNTVATQDSVTGFTSSLAYKPADSLINPDSGKDVIIAKPIVYDVIVKNPDKTDEWTEECLKNTDAKTLIKLIFQKVYDGELIAYDRLTDEPLTKEEVKEIEQKYDINDVGKLMFEEDWYYDPKRNVFYKVVKSMVFGYERRDESGQVNGYKAGFKVYFGEEKNQNPAAK